MEMSPSLNIRHKNTERIDFYFQKLIKYCGAKIKNK